MDLNWGKPVAAADTWIGGLDGALLAPNTDQVSHLIAKRGFVLPTRGAVPLDRLARWDREGYYLDISILEFLALPRLRSSYGDGTETCLSSRTRVLLADGTRLRLKGLRLSQDSSVEFLLSSRRGPGRPSLLCPGDRVTDLGSQEVSVGISERDLEGLPQYRPDHDIENDLWEALYASEDISEVDLRGVRAHVLDSVVIVEGNVRARSAISGAERLARSVNGVAGVSNHLVSDWDIELAVASYISREVPDLAGEVAIRSQIGTVILDGRAPSNEAKERIIQGVQSLHGIQGIEDQIEVRPPSAAAAGSTHGEGEAAMPQGPSDKNGEDLGSNSRSSP